MPTKPPYYRIYLLTVWQEQSRGPPAPIIWRFRLEDPRSGRQQLFADLSALMVALQQLTLLRPEATDNPAATNDGISTSEQDSH